MLNSHYEILGFNPDKQSPLEVEFLVRDAMAIINTEGLLRKAILLFCHPTVRKVVPDIDCYWSNLADKWLFENVPKVIVNMPVNQFRIVIDFIKSKFSTSWCILGFLILTVKYGNSIRFIKRLAKLLDVGIVHDNTMLNSWFGLSLLDMMGQRLGTIAVPSWTQIINDGSIVNAVDCSAILVSSSTNEFNAVRTENSMVTLTVGHSIQFTEVLVTKFDDTACSVVGWVIGMESAQLQQGSQIHLTMDHAKGFDLSRSAVLELTNVNVNISLIDRNFIPSLLQTLALAIGYQPDGVVESGVPVLSTPPSKTADPNTTNACDADIYPHGETLFFDSSPIKMPYTRPRRHFDCDDETGVIDDLIDIRVGEGMLSPPNSATAYSNLSDLGKRRHLLVKELYHLQQQAQEKTSELQIIDIEMQKVMMELGLALEGSR